MKTLKRFAYWWNSNDEVTPGKLDKLQYTDELLHMMNTYCTLKEQSGNALRISSMGKPLIELACAKLDTQVHTYKDRCTYWVISMGIYGEALIKSLMLAKGFTFTHDQTEVKLGPMVGHVDGVVDGTTVFDIKFMSHMYFRDFTTSPDDSRGYITQLSLYRKALNLPKAAFLCFNKTTGECRIVRLQRQAYQEALYSVKEKLEVLKKVRTVEDMVKYVKPPEPRVLSKGKHKGKRVVPDSMKYSKYVEAIYGSDYLVDEAHYKKWEP